MWQWQFEPIPVAGIVNLCLLYVLGVYPFRIAYFHEPFPLARAISFASSMVIFLLLIITPLHLIAEVYLVSVHMVQFMVLICVVVPLFLLGLPAWLLRLLLTNRYVYPPARFLTRPLVAFVVYNVTFTFWHIPAVFRVFLYSDIWHGALYITIFGAACLAMFPVMSPLPEALPPLPYGKRLVYLLAILLAHLPISGIIAFYPRPLYPFYQPQVFGLTLMQDQYTGSILMAVSMMLAVLTGMTITFLRWFAAGNDRGADINNDINANNDEQALPT